MNEQRVLVPKASGPWRKTDSQSQIHAQENPQEQLDAFQPAGGFMVVALGGVYRRQSRTVRIAAKR